MMWLLGGKDNAVAREAVDWGAWGVGARPATRVTGIHLARRPLEKVKRDGTDSSRDCDHRTIMGREGQTKLTITCARCTHFAARHGGSKTTTMPKKNLPENSNLCWHLPDQVCIANQEMWMWLCRPSVILTTRMQASVASSKCSWIDLAPSGCTLAASHCCC